MPEGVSFYSPTAHAKMLGDVIVFGTPLFWLQWTMADSTVAVLKCKVTNPINRRIENGKCMLWNKFSYLWNSTTSAVLQGIRGIRLQLDTTNWGFLLRTSTDMDQILWLWRSKPFGYFPASAEASLGSIRCFKSLCFNVCIGSSPIYFQLFTWVSSREYITTEC